MQQIVRYPSEIFSNPMIEHFRCTYCNKIMLDPIKDAENHMFCRQCIIECINRHLLCPTTGHTIVLSEIHDIDPELKVMYG